MKKFKVRITTNTENGYERFILPFIGLIFDKRPRWGWACIIFGVCWWKWHLGLELRWEIKQ